MNFIAASLNTASGSGVTCEPHTSRTEHPKPATTSIEQNCPFCSIGGAIWIGRVRDAVGRWPRGWGFSVNLWDFRAAAPQRFRLSTPAEGARDVPQVPRHTDVPYAVGTRYPPLGRLR